MPLITIRRNPDKIRLLQIARINKALPPVAAAALSTKEGGILPPEDIMIEWSDISSYDVNLKDINIRVIAHDYPERRGENLDKARRTIAEEVVRHLPPETSWYVWPMILETSYGSDTEK